MWENYGELVERDLRMVSLVVQTTKKICDFPAIRSIGFLIHKYKFSFVNKWLLRIYNSQQNFVGPDKRVGLSYVNLTPRILIGPALALISIRDIQFLWKTTHPADRTWRCSCRGHRGCWARQRRYDCHKYYQWHFNYFPPEYFKSQPNKHKPVNPTTTNKQKSCVTCWI